MQFVVLLGLVSLFGDVTYEGARSITGPYLAVLGASGAAVGVTAGLGELVGYGLRLVSGWISDRTRRYWAITLLGYGVNLLAVPALALAGRWEVAAALIVAERFGKAIRTPARDAMLSHATTQMGRGWGFGLHEAMDQIGAVLGPLVVAGVLAARTEDYRQAFGLLLIPAGLALVALLTARFLYPRPQDLDKKAIPLETEGFSSRFWLYLLAVGLIAVGYADFPLIAFHLGRAGVTPAGTIPLLYATAMAVDAVAALVFGRAFDRLGPPVLVGGALISALFAPLVFLGGSAGAWAGMVLWGVGMGAQESVMRAMVAEMSPPERRGSAYGLFNSGYGLAWFLGSALLGFLYDRTIGGLVFVSVSAQLAAVLLLGALLWRGRR
ncbi:MAG: MFS transporter [Caldilineae bacterium]|nr:MAG: MFS transporter [Caldilineae bacterium]